MKPCKCHKCKPVLDGMRADISPLRNTPPRDMGCVASHPCIDPESVECACPTPKESVLEEAQRLVHGDRGAHYGHPYFDYRCTGQLWKALLEHYFHRIGFLSDDQLLPEIPPRIACEMVIALKLSREMNKDKRDNRTDIAGYAECAQMIAEFPVNEAR